VIPLRLRADELRSFHAALRETGTYQVEVSLLNLDGDEVSRVTPEVLDGQVDVDADADVTRQCSLTLYDPSHSLQLDSDSPDDGALHADRMLHVVYSVLVPALNDRVDVPVFTGPIVSFERSDDEVSIHALGKEELALNEIWRPLTLKKGMSKVEAIRTILAERTGETRFDFPEIDKPRLPHRVSLGRMVSAWKRARRIARSMNRQLYYDGRGVCRLRVRPRRPVFTFYGGADHPKAANITKPVHVTHDFTEIKNVVWVKGGKPKGAKRAVHAVAVAPRSHPLSPWRLGRNGEQRYLVEEIDNDAIRSSKEAKRRAEAKLEDLLTETVGVTFAAIPIPHLDPLDVVRVVTDDFTANVRLRKFSLPLTTGGEMTVGYHERVKRDAKRQHHRRHRRHQQRHHPHHRRKGHRR
jgi:hypothetical protein